MAILATFTQPTDLFICGWMDSDFDNDDIVKIWLGITDDESGIDVYIGEYETRGFSSDGYIRMFTREELRKIADDLLKGETVENMNTEPSYFYIKGCLGEIGLHAIHRETGEEFLPTYDVNHKRGCYISDNITYPDSVVDSEGDEHYECQEFIRFPEGTVIQRMTLRQLINKAQA